MDLLLYALLNKKIKSGGGGSAIEVDPTLSKAGQAADAAVTGEKFNNSVGKKTTDGGEIFNDYTYNKASGENSHAEGHGTIASGNYSHTEGYFTTASGNYSHTEGLYTTASGGTSHAEGLSTTASGLNSHAEGADTKASGENSHAEGHGTIAKNDQHVQGKFNVEDTNNKFAFIIGNGDGITSRSNAFAIGWDGKIYQGNTNTGINIADLISGYLPLDGNAATATKLQTARTINGVPFDGSENVNIPLQRCHFVNDSATWADTPWHKIASASWSGANGDRNLVLFVSRGWKTSGSGILKLNVRSGTQNLFESGYLTWLIADNTIIKENFVAIYTNDTTSGTITVELWAKMSGPHDGYEIIKLADHSRSSSLAEWTLYNSNSGVESYTAGTGTIVSTLATIQNPVSGGSVSSDDSQETDDITTM